MKTAQEENNPITPIGLQQGVIEHHNSIIEDMFSFVFDACKYIQNTISGFGLPTSGLFHKEEIDKLESQAEDYQHG